MSTALKLQASILAFILGPRAVASEMIFPGENWVEAAPASQGLNAAKLKEAVRHLESNTGRDGARELVIVRNGRMLWRGDNIDQVHGIWSCTKSFTSTVLGLLVEDGKCSLETRAASALPAMQKHYPNVTLRHFGTMTSGYRAVGDETAGSYTHGPSGTPFQPAAEPLFAPGTAYAYWDSAMNQCGHALTVIAGEPLNELFKRRIADPIGMNPSAWKWGDFGVVNGLRVNGAAGNNGKHVQISAREMARFGHLFLNEGRWNGRQILSSNWIRQATAVQVPAHLTNAWTKSEIAGPGFYGFNWWRNAPGPDGKMLWPGAPADAFGASGHNNNKLFVIPSWRTVVVRLGLDQSDRKWTEEAQGEFLRLLGEAIEDRKTSEERNGLVAVEAESFIRQTLTEKRSWKIARQAESGSAPHAKEASGGAFVECLPDTRRTHDDKLVPGENFSNVPGAMAVLHYRVRFNTPGRYYVWARAYSSGTEDNGLHVGLDGEWPESGGRLQWCEGKNSWRWESKQRTDQEHCGEPFKIFLDVKTAGEHGIQFSMREDGFVFDKFLLTLDRNFVRPEGSGPRAD